MDASAIQRVAARGGLAFDAPKKRTPLQNAVLPRFAELGYDVSGAARSRLPSQFLHSTQIPVCLWLLANNKDKGKRRD